MSERSQAIASAAGFYFYLFLFQRNGCLVRIWIFYTIIRLGWEIINAFEYLPSDITMRFASWIVYGAFDVFVLLNLPVFESTPVGSTPPLPPPPSPPHSICLPGDDPPAYEDVVSTCIEIESGVAVKQQELPPPPYTSCVWSQLHSFLRTEGKTVFETVLESDTKSGCASWYCRIPFCKRTLSWNIRIWPAAWESNFRRRNLARPII